MLRRGEEVALSTGAELSEGAGGPVVSGGAVDWGGVVVLR